MPIIDDAKKAAENAAKKAGEQVTYIVETTEQIQAEMAGLDKLDAGQLAARAIQLLQQTEYAKALSGPAKALTNIFGSTLAEVLRTGDLKSVDLASLGNALLSQAWDVVQPLLDKVLKELAVDVGKEISGVVPIVGQVAFFLIAIFTDPAYKASGTGAASDDIQVRAEWCRAQYTPPLGTGPGNQVLPADYFNEGKNGYGEMLVISSVGELLIAATEKTWPMLKSKAKGVPVERQRLFKLLRLAIQKSWKKGDGGASLWPLYLDLLRRETDEGTVTEEYLVEVLDRISWQIIKEVREKGETSCAAHDQRPARDVIALARGWKLTIHPFYTQFPNPEKALKEIERRVRLLAAEPGLRLRGRTVATKPSRGVALAGITGGLALIGLGAWGLLKGRAAQ